MEWLKEILGEEEYKSVKEKLDKKGIKLANLNDGKYIPVDKFNNKIEENKLYKEQIETYKNKNIDVDKLLNDNKELKNQYETLNTDFTTKLSDKDNEINNISKKYALNKVFSENKVVYPDLLLNQLDMNNIELEGDQLKNFKIEDIKTKYPKMFETVETSGNINPQNSKSFNNNLGNDAAKLLLLKESYSKYLSSGDITRAEGIRKQIVNLKK